MVERAGRLLDPLRLAAHLDDQRLGDQPQLARGRSRRRSSPASRCTSTGVPVNVIAGCSASGSAPGAQRRVQHGGAVPAGGVHQELPGADGAGLGEARRRGRAARRRGRSAGRGRRARAPGRGRTSGTPGSRAAARRRDASETPEAATGRCPASCSAAARAGPTRPAPTTPDGQPGRAVPPRSGGFWGCVHAARAFRSSPRGVPDAFSSILREDPPPRQIPRTSAAPHPRTPRRRGAPVIRSPPGTAELPHPTSRHGGGKHRCADGPTPVTASPARHRRTATSHVPPRRRKTPLRGWTHPRTASPARLGRWDGAG